MKLTGNQFVAMYKAAFDTGPGMITKDPGTAEFPEKTTQDPRHDGLAGEVLESLRPRGRSDPNETSKVPLPVKVNVHQQDAGETPNTATKPKPSSSEAPPLSTARTGVKLSGLMGLLTQVLLKSAMNPAVMPSTVPMNRPQTAMTQQLPPMPPSMGPASPAVPTPPPPMTRMASVVELIDDFFKAAAPIISQPMVVPPAASSGPLKTPGLGQVAGAGLGSQQMRPRNSLPQGSSVPPTVA